MGGEHRTLHAGKTEDTQALGGAWCNVKLKVKHTHRLTQTQTHTHTPWYMPYR